MGQIFIKFVKILFEDPFTVLFHKDSINFSDRYRSKNRLRDFHNVVGFAHGVEVHDRCTIVD